MSRLAEVRAWPRPDGALSYRVAPVKSEQGDSTVNPAIPTG